MTTIKNFIKEKWQFVLAAACFSGFFALAQDVFDKDVMNGDKLGYDIISNILMSDAATAFARFITNLSDVAFLLPLTAALFIFIKNRKIGLSIIINLVIVSGLNILLKNILQRPRPTAYRLIEESGYSFPSGHAMISMAFFGLLIYFIFKYVKNKRLKWPLIILLSFLIFAIGVSRIYLGVHYTSDVLAGFLISFAYLVVYITIIKKTLFKNDSGKHVSRKNIS